MIGARHAASSNLPISIGFLGSMGIVGAVLVFMYASTFQPTVTDLLLSAVALLTIGLSLAYMLVGIRFLPFDLKHFGTSLIWTVFAVVMIFTVNRVVPFTLGVSVLNLRWFAVLMGVAEECFFRLFLCGFIEKVSRSKIFAIVISAFVWTIYHIARYSGNPSALWIVLFAGMGLGFTLVQSRLGDGVIFAHAIVNFLASA